MPLLPINPNMKRSSDPNPLVQVVSIFAKHMDAKSHYLVGLSLWAFHTHIYNQYSKSPRLSILSPVPNCGKTTVLDILNAMVWNPRRMIDPTVASTFRLANSHTLLIDEVDDMSVVKNMRAILNAGHGVGGSVDRTNSEGNVISYNVYGPVAMAGIGKLPASLMSRSLVIRLRRSNKQMQPFKPPDQYYAPQFYSWGAQAALNSNPQMPIQLIGREADKWRPLIAIADYFDQGDIGRAVALEFLNESNTPDIKESILCDTERVFDRLNVDIITADALYHNLQEDEDGDYEVDYVEQKITKRVIGIVLSDFQIRSRPYRHKGGQPQRCWFREDFEEMWKRYS